MVTAQSVQLLRLYRHYRAGHLLVAGGIGDQPSYYLDAMAEIDALREDAEGD